MPQKDKLQIAAPPLAISRRYLLSGGVATGACLVAGKHAVAANVPPTLTELLQEFARRKTFRARFTEEKRILLIKAPLVNQGRIYFLAPEHFCRVVEKPQFSQLVLNKKRLRIVDSTGKSRTITIADKPSLAAMVSGLTAVFSGNVDVLGRLYDSTYTVGKEQWSLALAPKASREKPLVKGFLFEGDAAAIRRMRVEEASGDVSETHFSEIRYDQPFTAAERQKLFGL